MEKILVSTSEAAAMMSMSRRQLYHLMETGQLRFMQPGRQRLIPTSELHSYVARSLVPMGLSPLRTRILDTLRTKGPMGPRPLARELGCSHQNVWQALQGLAQKGLVVNDHGRYQLP